MLKLNASYSKKVPADQEYSSQSYHASVEVELPDGLTGDQLQKRIHDTFILVKDSVESEISNGNQNEVNIPVPKANVPITGKDQPKPVPLASQKQVKFLLDLARTLQINITTCLSKYGVKNAFDLDRNACSKLIDELKSATA